VSSDCSNRDSLPTITFTISGDKFELGPEFYVLEADGQCQLGIEMVNPGISLFILGDPFIRKYYTVFNRKTNMVGFALANQNQPAISAGGF
jgi:saccharopepsin